MLRKEERLVFTALCQAHPDFAGATVNWEEGPDPPDYIGTDPADHRIGVELGEWLNEEQMGDGKRQERAEDSFFAAIRSEQEDPPHNVGTVWVFLKEEGVLPPEDATQFRAEILECIRAVDTTWTRNPERDNPQDYDHIEFSAYPCLQKYLTALQFRSARRSQAHRGIAWVCFPPKGSPYTPKPAVDALLKLLEKKTKKYANLRAALNLDALYLVAYWNRGLIYNSPFLAGGFDFQDVARLAREAVARNPGPFQKIFLFNALPQDLDLAELYPFTSRIRREADVAP
jgi:hypothetical protein